MKEILFKIIVIVWLVLVSIALLINRFDSLDRDTFQIKQIDTLQKAVINIQEYILKK